MMVYEKTPLRFKTVTPPLPQFPLQRAMLRCRWPNSRKAGHPAASFREERIPGSSVFLGPHPAWERKDARCMRMEIDLFLRAGEGGVGTGLGLQPGGLRALDSPSLGP